MNTHSLTLQFSVVNLVCHINEYSASQEAVRHKNQEITRSLLDDFQNYYLSAIDLAHPRKIFSLLHLDQEENTSLSGEYLQLRTA